MIKNFICKDTEKVFEMKAIRRFSADLQKRIRRKLVMLDAAVDLQDLRVPPANRLEKLRGDRQAQYSIRVNEQWRICFVWEAGHAYQVECIDYH